MSTSFAGSRCLDERRRRRLAGEADEARAGSPAPPAGAPAASGDHSSDAAPAPATVSHFPLGRLISRKLWKLWAVGLLILLLAGNVLLAGSAVAGGEMRLGPGFSSLFRLSAARVLKPLATLLLLLCAQLAWLIWWVRSRSPRDFDGRYRQWGWCAAFGAAATFALATDLHLAWAQTALWLWDFDVWNKTRVVWLLPIALAAAWTLRALHREMRDCRVSHTLLWMAAVCGAGIAVLNLHAIPLPFAPDEQRLLHWSAELTACWLLFMSLLTHARHVVHVTADPARLRPSRFTWRSLLRLPKFPARRKNPKAKAEQAKKSAKPQKEQQEKNQSATADQPARPKSKARRKTRAKNTESEGAKPSAQQPKGKPAKPEPAVEENGAEPVAETGPDTLPLKPVAADDPMQGLSKRERRRLRKQRRDGKSQRRAA